MTKDSSSDVAQVDSKLAKLLQRCGIDVMPPCHTMLVPIESIIVPDLELVRPSAALLKSIRTYGIRQPPSVAFLSGSAYDALDAKYVAVMGSRRAVSARTLFFKEQDPRFKTIKCEVYEWNVPGLNDVLALQENSLRSDAWVRDIIRLRRLIEQKIALSLDDLADYGFQRNTIKKKLDIALLPATLLDPICAGELSMGTAMKIVRLKEGPRMQLVALVQSGKTLTADLVSQVYRGQVDQGMAPVQEAMLKMWQQSATSTQLPHNGHVESVPSSVSALNEYAHMDHMESDSPSPAQMLTMLQRFEATVQTNPALSHLVPLTRVYISELQTALRTVSPASATTETTETHTKEEVFSC